MEKQLGFLRADKTITSRDHRVVQAIAMLGRVKGIALRFQFPNAVNKSWPQFWEFLDA